MVGPTATGKSALALALARHLGDAEIVSVDSMQVYRGMDIGTAKPSPAERAEITHHLIDIADPGEDFSVARYRDAFDAVVREIEARGRRAVLVGGTGLYLRAVIDRLQPPGEWPAVRAELDREPDTVALHERLVRLDPIAAARMEPTNRRRVIRALEVCVGSGQPFSSFGPGLTAYPPIETRQLGLRVGRDELSARIAARLRDQLAAGFLDEVRALAARPAGLSRTAAQALGYKELLAHVAGELSLDEAIELAVRRTRQFAVRQERWFRRDPRITWLDGGDGANPLEAALALLGDSTPCA